MHWHHQAHSSAINGGIFDAPKVNRIQKKRTVCHGFSQQWHQKVIKTKPTTMLKIKSIQKKRKLQMIESSKVPKNMTFFLKGGRFELARGGCLCPFERGGTGHRNQWPRWRGPPLEAWGSTVGIIRWEAVDSTC